MNNRTTHGGTGTRLFNIWCGIKKRCKHTDSKNYEYYAAKGITVCDEWESDFDRFRVWSMDNGYNDSLTIDRKDNSLGYSPDNCRWATRKEQDNNRTNNVIVNFKGKEMTLGQVADELGVSCQIVHYRHRNGMKLDTPKFEKLANKKSGIRGVSWSKQNGKWLARYKNNGKTHYGGYFNNLEEAEKAVVELRATVDK